MGRIRCAVRFRLKAKISFIVLVRPVGLPEIVIMSRVTPAELASRISAGLLSFPVTHFGENGDFLPEQYRQHIGWMLESGPAALFAAGGTGEFFSLTPAEYSEVVSAAVLATAGRVPVLAGCGYGTRTAIEFARAANAAGADGLLLFPPYLVNADSAGLIAHARAVCDSTNLGVIFYNRDNAVLAESSLEQLCGLCPNLIGLKDGHGDLELMTRICTRLGGRLVYVGGLPTAETFALPYLEIGVSTYSSAIFNFLPRLPSPSMPQSGDAITRRCSKCCVTSFCPTLRFAIAAKATRCRL